MPTTAGHGGVDAAVADLRTGAGTWAAMSVGQRLATLARLRRDVAATAHRWVADRLAAEGIDPATPTAGEEWLTGPYFVLRNLRLLENSLRDIERFGRPRPAGTLRRRPDGQVVVPAYPHDRWDALFMRGVRAEVWMEPGVTEAGVVASQAGAYRQGAGGATGRDGASGRDGTVALVLGAGNVSAIGPMDVLHRLFVLGHAVAYKPHALQASLSPLVEEGFRALVDLGALRIIDGSADVGAYLAHHPDVDEVHLTGSARTYEALVFGRREEGADRKARREPALHKPVTAELGNVDPVIVVPGHWSDDDLDFQAEGVASMVANNAGFNCMAPQLVVTHAGWPQRDRFLEALRRAFSRIPTRAAFYPGTRERYLAFTTGRPAADSIGRADGEALPWALVPDLDPERRDEPFFSTETFCGVLGEVALPAPTPGAYLERAVAFANERLWGTLAATVLVDPRSLGDPATRTAFDRAIADLRYGTVAVNVWSAVGFGCVVTPWGGFPGSPAHDIGSGTGFVHDTLMLGRAQKTVLRAPFRPWPRPVWFATHRTAARLGAALSAFESRPSVGALPRLLVLGAGG